MFNKQAIGFKLASTFLLVQCKCDDPRAVQYEELSERFNALLGSKEVKALLKQKEDLDPFKAQTGQLSKAQQESLMCLVAGIRAKEQRKSTQELQQQELQDAKRARN